MAISVTVSRVIFEPSNGRVLVSFTDGTGFEFRSKAEFDEAGTKIDPRDFAKQVVIAMMKARGITNPALIEGKTVSMDLTVNTWGTVS